jgi:hypothetical protein
LRLVLGYSVKNYIELPHPSTPVLSPFDYEHVVLEDYALQPEITPSGVIGDLFFIRVPECEHGIYINKDRLECRAEAGFSHPAHGVAVVKSLKGPSVVTSNEVFECETALYDSRPGAFIAACFEGSYTHVVVADYSGLKTYRELYKRKPSSVHVGFNSYSVVFDDYRSILLYHGGSLAIGIPLSIIAYIGDYLYGLSGRWLVRVKVDGSYEPLVLLREGYGFAGASSGLPVFNINNKLYRLEGGALVELDFAKGVEKASVHDIIVVDNGRLLRAYDPAGKLFLELPKDPGVNCYATRYGVLCCRSGLCGVVEPDTSIIQVDTVNREAHELRVASNIPLLVNYNDAVYRCRPSSVLSIREESASVLRKYLFELVLDHLLSSEYLSLALPPARIIVEASGRAYESSGLHECGGLSLVELRVDKLEKPSRVKLEILGREIATGVSTLCSDESPEKLVIEAVDATARDRVQLGRVVVEKNYYTFNAEEAGLHT